MLLLRWWSVWLRCVFCWCILPGQAVTVGGGPFTVTLLLTLTVIVEAVIPHCCWRSYRYSQPHPDPTPIAWTLHCSDCLIVRWPVIPIYAPLLLIPMMTIVDSLTLPVGMALLRRVTFIVGCCSICDYGIPLQRRFTPDVSPLTRCYPVFGPRYLPIGVVTAWVFPRYSYLRWYGDIRFTIAGIVNPGDTVMTLRWFIPIDDLTITFIHCIRYWHYSDLTAEEFVMILRVVTSILRFPVFVVMIFPVFDIVVDLIVDLNPR